jgi:hypothetical protein
MKGFFVLPHRWVVERTFSCFGCRSLAMDYESLADTLLALQLHFSFEVSASGFGLVCASPQRPCEDVGGLDASLCEFGGDAADFLD